ncbi:protein PilX [Lysobacteraceae bacterium NML07-0707]|nr:protein PilX [Xanthomonadaceae bacterium NML07-0707]
MNNKYHLSLLIIHSRARQQHGAALYMAMIMLIIMALLGLIGMRVIGLQERMAADYMRSARAFQGAEADLRKVELDIQAKLRAGDSYDADFSPRGEDCKKAFDGLAWANTQLTATTPKDSHTTRIDYCIQGAASVKVGGRTSEGTNNVYQITVISNDDDTDPYAQAVLDVVYIP